MSFIKKFIFVLVFTIILFCKPSYGSNVSFPDGLLIGDENGIYVDVNGDYIMYADRMKAGDVINRSLIIENIENNQSFELFMSSKPLFSTGPIDLLDKISLNLKLDEKEIYSGRLYGDDGINMVTNSLPLGKYYYGDSAVLNITVKLDENIPKELFYNKSVAEIIWKFTAIKEEASDLPKTGQIIKKWLYILSVCMMFVIIMLFIIKRHNANSL